MLADDIPSQSAESTAATAVTCLINLIRVNDRQMISNCVSDIKNCERLYRLYKFTCLLSSQITVLKSDKDLPLFFSPSLNVVRVISHCV